MYEKALHKQPLFWVLVAVPIMIGLFLFYPIMTEYEPDRSVSGIVLFAELSKLQFSIMLLSIPIGALVARIHSTIQKEKEMQIKSHENDIADEEIIITQITTYIDFVKHELTLKSSKDDIFEYSPINDNVSWIRAAKDIICIFKLRKSLEIEKNQERCDELLERLNLFLYRNLGNNDDCLPVQFFTGSKTWLEDYENLESRQESNQLKENILIDYIHKHKGQSFLSSRSSLSNTTPRFSNTTIMNHAICCIFDFINQFVDSFDSQINTKKEFTDKAINHDLIDWPIWDNKLWLIHESRKSECAAKYITLYQKAVIEKLTPTE